MSSVGFDFGNLNTVVSVAQKKGIDTVTNDLSNRLTPSLVAFTDKRRLSGEEAKSQEIRNLRNTIPFIKRLIGKKFEVNDKEKNFYECLLIEGKNGFISVEIDYQGGKVVFTPNQLLGLFLVNMKKILAENGLTKLSNPVFAVPDYYTIQQRGNVLDAAYIAGIPDMKIINETTALTFCYGLIRGDTLKEEQQMICFIDIGHTSMQTCFVKMSKTTSEIIGTEWSENIGGRLFDLVLINHFSMEIEKKHGINISENKKALYRLKTSCEKTKKMLTTNPEISMSVENIGNDLDFSQTIKRETFDNLSEEILGEIDLVLTKLCEKTKIQKENIFSVELAGGSTRIISVRKRIENFFQKPVKTSLNSEEAISRGCTIASATMSPTIRVREHKITTILNEPIFFEWKKDDGKTGEVCVFEKGSIFPATRMFSIKRTSSFSVSIKRKYQIMIVDVDMPEREAITVKMKIHIGIDEILSVLEVFTEETIFTEDEKEEKRISPLAFNQKTTRATFDEVEAMREEELKMFECDRLVLLTEREKNELEELIYNLKDKFDTKYKEFSHEEELKKIKKLLSENEEWLYTDGEDSSRGDYNKRKNSLLESTKPIKERFNIYQQRLDSIKELKQQSLFIIEETKSKDEKYSHISEEEKLMIRENCFKIETWLDEQIALQNELYHWDKPILLSEQIKQKKLKLFEDYLKTMNKPKPEPVKEKKEQIEDEDQKMKDEDETKSNSNKQDN